MSGTMGRKKVRVYHSDDQAVINHHFHNAYELILIEEGGARFTIDGREYLCGEGHLLLLNDLERHEMEPLPGRYSRFVAILDPTAFDQHVGEPELYSIFKRRPARFDHRIALDAASAVLARRTLESCMEECERGAPFYEACVLSRLLQLLIHLYRGYREHFPPVSSHSAELVQSVQSYLDTHYADDLTLESVSARAHVDKYHLAHIFREVTGYTVKQYILLKRISHAKSLLYYTGKDISHVAADSGFHSSSNFIRFFKNREGITPAQYRKLFMERDKSS